MAALKRIISRLLLPLADAVVVYVGLFFLARYWNGTVLAARGSGFPQQYYYLVLPIYILVWILSMLVCKGYAKPSKPSNVNKGIVLGTVAILLVYALLPETLRFSRAVLLLGTLWTLVSVNLLHSLSRRLPRRGREVAGDGSRRVAVVGSVEEAERVLSIVRMMGTPCHFWGIITLDEPPTSNPRVIGRLSQIGDLVTLYRINEVIFCSRDLSSEQIIGQMCALQSAQVEFKIAPEGSVAVIGSNSIFSSEDAYTVQVHAITQKESRIRKRCFDIVTAVLLLLLLPVDVWFVRRKGGFVRNIFAVLSGRKSWVGFCRPRTDGALAQLRLGVLTPVDNFRNNDFSDEMLALADQLYARDYTVKNDIVIVWRGFSKLGNL